MYVCDLESEHVKGADYEDKPMILPKERRDPGDAPFFNELLFNTCSKMADGSDFAVHLTGEDVGKNICRVYDEPLQQGADRVDVKNKEFGMVCHQPGMYLRFASTEKVVAVALAVAAVVAVVALRRPRPRPFHYAQQPQFY